MFGAACRDLIVVTCVLPGAVSRFQAKVVTPASPAAAFATQESRRPLLWMPPLPLPLMGAVGMHAGLAFVDFHGSMEGSVAGACVFREIVQNVGRKHVREKTNGAGGGIKRVFIRKTKKKSS